MKTHVPREDTVRVLRTRERRVQKNMGDADWDKGEAVEVIFLYSGKECSLFPPQCLWGCWLRSWTLPFCVSATKDHELQGDSLALELGSHQLAERGLQLNLA